MKKFIFGLIIGIIIVPLAAYLYFVSGSAPVATSDPPMPFEKFMATTALHARIEKEMPKSVPMQANEAAYQAGAQVYMHHCAGCHGALNQTEDPMAKGMFPHPPMLLPPHKGVTDDPPGETFWKVDNGIRLSGMPSFSDQLSQDQMWQVSLMLANADKLPDSVKKDLVPGPPPPAPPPANKKK